jgi:hypothetical protein
MFDLGMIATVRTCAPKAAVRGELGLPFKNTARGESAPIEVSRVDPAGPCAKLLRNSASARNYNYRSS